MKTNRVTELKQVITVTFVVFATVAAEAQITPPDRSAVRHLPTTYAPGVPVEVELEVNLLSGYVWAVEDGIPAGWAVTDISDAGSFDTFNRKVKWLFFDGPQSGGPTNRTLSYVVIPPAGESGTRYFDGRWSVDGSLDPILGDNGIDSFTDADGDGVEDSIDLCPNTPAGVIVNDTGCSIGQLCPCEAPWRNHGEYIKAVVGIAEDFRKAGLITTSEQKSVVLEAASSGCGKRSRQ